MNYLFFVICWNNDKTGILPAAPFIKVLKIFCLNSVNAGGVLVRRQILGFLPARISKTFAKAFVFRQLKVIATFAANQFAGKLVWLKPGWDPLKLLDGRSSFAAVYRADGVTL